MDENKNERGISPLYFEVFDYYAEIENKDGEIRHVKVGDPKLAGVRLPATVNNPEKLLRQMEKQINISRSENVPMVKNTAANQPPIIRADSAKKSSVQDVTNFLLSPKIRYVFIDRQGKRNYERERIYCEILFNGIQQETLEIFTKDIRNLCKIILNSQ